MANLKVETDIIAKISVILEERAGIFVIMSVRAVISHQCRQYIIVFEISDNMYVSHLPLGKLDIFSLMCGADKVWITKLTLN
jgi:hypothetical protein